MTNAHSVIVADSCIGGLSVLHSLWQTGYANKAVFLADYATNPLGTKDEATIAAVVQRWLSLAAVRAETLIIACNTLSIRYRRLRQADSTLPEVGNVVSMVDCFDAMLTVLGDELAGNRILIIGTEYTVGQSLYQTMLRDCIPDAVINAIAATELERQIARIEPWDDQAPTALTRELRTALGRCEVAILACTCFPMVTDHLQKLFPQVLFIDPGQFCAQALATTAPDTTADRALSLCVTGNSVTPAAAVAFARSYLTLGSVESLPPGQLE